MRRAFLGLLVLLLGAGLVSAGSVMLGWDEATPLDQLSGFRLYQGTASRTYDTVIPVGLATSASLSGLTDGLTYYFTATAVDLQGVESPYSNEVSTVVGPADTMPPVISITSPTNGAKVPKHSSVTVAAQASDNVGVDHVMIYVDGALLCADGTMPYSCSWQVPAANGRQYTLQAKAWDAAGNMGVSPLIQVIAQ